MIMITSSVVINKAVEKSEFQISCSRSISFLEECPICGFSFSFDLYHFLFSGL